MEPRNQNEIDSTKKQIEVLQEKLQELEKPTPEEQAEMEKNIDKILNNI